MRNEILKFRSWDGLNKKFSFWTINDLCIYSEKDEKPSALDNWQQYTGLKDKNEKNIYEGDIVRVGDSKWFDKNYYDVGIVEFKTPAWYFANIIPYSIVQSGSEVKNTPSTHYNTFEIIGNVYENENLFDK